MTDFSVKQNISINAPSDLPLFSQSIRVPFELFSRLFDSLDNRAIVFACPTLVRFHVLRKKKMLISENK